MRRLIVESLETRLLLAGPDTTPPLLGIKEPAADVPVEVGSELKIVVEAADPESGISQVAFAYRLGGQPTVELGTDKEPEDGFTVILSTKSMPLGSISLIATATNGAGLISVAETKTTLVDLTAPTVILKSPTLDNALSIGDTVRFQAEAADGQSGLKSIQFLADTDPEVEGPEVVAAFDVTGPSGEAQFDLSTAKFGFGLLAIGVAASDQAGLAASEALKIFLHDPTAPIASFIAPTDGTPYSPGRLLLITVQATDPESGIQSVLLRADLDSDSSNGYEFETEAVAGGNSEYSGIFSARDLADGQSVLIEAVVTNGDGDSLAISHSMTADGTPPAVLVRLIQDTGTSAEDLITRNGLIQIDAGDG